ncbi:MAG: hypothetical protein A3I17_01795 [Candidatus Rokubacteria bacterium RIFCSPLOWO2_02_FULL_72_37]|nr:MAG: hypothetical protein A3I17_01795 [Candidatus Rokubacteria bacterium RIFCSPLOWO2_02_FULL_72_37]
MQARRQFLTARLAVLAIAVLLAVLPASAVETPIGDTKRVAEAALEVAAVYLQPIEMEPATHQGRVLYLTRDKADIHLEADIHALPGSKHGFRDGEWIPGLTVRFVLKHLDSGAEQSGILHPMAASDGPHYGANLKMSGLGTYRLTFLVEPPGQVPADAPVRQGLGRSARATPWWKPFTLEWTFKYFGPGKKGGY